MSDLFWRGVACALARFPRLLNRLLQVAYRNPYFHLPGYMERWWLLPAPPKEDEVHDYPGALPRLTRLAYRLGLAARFHRILRADQGRHGHSHPWPFRTLILQGWYIEEIYNRTGELVGERRLRAGMTAYKTPDEFHRIRSISPGGVLTLVIHGKPTGKGWFFNRGGELIPWRVYLGLERKS